jgi:phenylalanyl-tRNA synthetase beta chain
MKLPISWLKEYIDFDLSPQELANELMLTGTAVESLSETGSGNEGVIIGEVLSVEKHPNADKLSICQVRIPNEELTIVCGAPNVRAGIKVPVAVPGAKLKNGLVVEKRGIRGVESSGMICSETELGIGDDASGIMILPDDTKLGESLDEALGLSDWVLELEITPNRPDCMSVIGIAREVSAITGNPLRFPAIDFTESAAPVESKADIEVLDEELCPRYIGMVIDDIKIGESPNWMKKRLLAAGMRPINNAVDVTNYVLLETGQPLHAFDWEKLQGHKIIVRRAKANEQMVTLDGVDRRLDNEVLVIADENRAVAIAGVMGSENSEVGDSTKTILLESAYFKPQNVMSTARKLGLLTESAARFEKGVDPTNTEFAAKRAIMLLQELCGGQVLKGKIDNYPKPIRPRQISLRPKRVNDILGTSLSSKKIASRIESLGLTAQVKDDYLSVTVPTFRQDLEREIDLIEEVARLEKYDSITSTLPCNNGSTGGLSQSQKLLEQIENILVGAGLWEAMSYSLIGQQTLANMNLPKDDIRLKTIKLLNPLSDESDTLRTTLIPGLIQSAKHNLSRNQYDVQLYEKGKIFARNENSFGENFSIAVLLTGNWHSKSWWGSDEPVDFFDLKGIIEQIIDALNIEKFTFKRSVDSIYHPGVSADIMIDNLKVGSFGQINPIVTANFQLPAEVFVAEMKFSALASLSKEVNGFREIPKFPSIERDISLLTDVSVASRDIVYQIKSLGGELLKNVQVFDLYTGKNIPEGKKSLAFSLQYRSDERTLTDGEVDKIHSKIIDALKDKGYEIR